MPEMGEKMEADVGEEEIKKKMEKVLQENERK